MPLGIERFSLTVEDDELDDLRRRLRVTRWPDAETDPEQGVALADLQALCAYWAGGYDWRRVEARLAAVGQYRTTIDGLGIHFLHARPGRSGGFPLILTHGWPGSVIEFLDVVEPLTEAGLTASCRPCPVTGGATSRANQAGASSALRGRGQR